MIINTNTDLMLNIFKNSFEQVKNGDTSGKYHGPISQYAENIKTWVKIQKYQHDT